MLLLCARSSESWTSKIKPCQKSDAAECLPLAFESSILLVSGHRLHVSVYYYHVFWFPSCETIDWLSFAKPTTPRVRHCLPRVHNELNNFEIFKCCAQAMTQLFLNCFVFLLIYFNSQWMNMKMPKGHLWNIRNLIWSIWFSRLLYWILIHRSCFQILCDPKLIG